jgi:hypothetical protein
MSSSAGQGFAEALLAAAAGPEPLRGVQAVLRQWAGERVYLPRTRPQDEDTAADLARRLVAAGVGRGAAVEILLQRRELSPRHARRLVRAAVDMRGQRMAALAPTIRPSRTTPGA